MKTRKGYGCGCWPILAVLVVILLVPLLWAGHKGSQPMSVADARGMTYWQFMAERFEKVREKPLACQTVDVATLTFGIPYFTAAYLWTGLHPDSAWNKTLNPDPEYPRRPENLAWSQVPEEAWRLVEEISWGAWAVTQVRNDIHAPDCYLRPVTYPGDLGASHLR